ncbi:collagen alpha-1(I) chain-like [Pteropus medius]|uniref:collagen alpha-1(I) chain-like n=1 Tax=Pteropus vampyrus TaxID=132908 RepID=UPI00196A4FE4|nr:collagen alpha-1(I) chain-like [Pteropus giganteus]
MRSLRSHWVLLGPNSSLFCTSMGPRHPPSKAGEVTSTAVTRNRTSWGTPSPRFTKEETGPGRRPRRAGRPPTRSWTGRRMLSSGEWEPRGPVQVHGKPTESHREEKGRVITWGCGHCPLGEGPEPGPGDPLPPLPTARLLSRRSPSKPAPPSAPGTTRSDQSFPSLSLSFLSCKVDKVRAASGRFHDARQASPRMHLACVGLNHRGYCELWTEG